MEMLIDASHAYRIEAVAWALEEHNGGTRPYPVFIVKHAKDICDHIVLWSGNKPDNYFTLVWRENGQGYDLALLPDFDKSARRYHALSGDKTQLTILGHIFLYQAAQSQLDLRQLQNRYKIRLGWGTGINETDVENYAEVTVRLRHLRELDKDEQETVSRYWVANQLQ